jgi:hypothetical protein
MVSLYCFLVKSAERVLSAVAPEAAREGRFTWLPPGFLQFLASFLRLFGKILARVSFLPWASSVFSFFRHIHAIAPISMSPHSPSRVQTPDILRSLIAASNASLVVISIPPTATVFSGNLDDSIFSADGPEQFVHPNDPMVIILSDRAHFRKILIRNCTASEVSLHGGGYLNGMFPIALGVTQPQIRIVRIVSAARSSSEGDLGLVDSEKVRFLTVTFGARTDEIAISQISVYGAVSPAAIPPRRCAANPAFLIERLRLLGGADLAHFYGSFQSRGRPQDSLEPDAAHHPADGRPKRQSCDGCHSRDACLRCAGCQQMLSGKCGGGALCHGCQGQRDDLQAAVDGLRAVNGERRDGVRLARGDESGGRAIAPAPGALPVAALVYELPPGGCDPHALFGVRASAVWAPETNLVQIHAAFQSECEVTRLEVNCEDAVTVGIGGAEWRL